MKRTSRLVSAVVAAFLIPFATAAGSDPAVRAASYCLDVSFDPAAGTLSGSADIRLAEPAQAVSTLDLYLHGELHFTSAQCGSVELPAQEDLLFYDMDYSSVARRLRLDVSQVDLSPGLHVTWQGPMNPSVSRARSNYMRIDADGVFLRSYGYSVWFPILLAGGESHCVDFESVVLRTPSAFQPVFIGSRLSEGVEGDQRVSRWCAPGVDLFDAQCSARRYGELTDGEVHIHHLQDPASEANARRILDFTRRLRAFYRRHYRHGATAGELHIAQLCRFGNISNANMVGLADDAWREFEPGSYSGRTLAHELVHAYVAVPTSQQSPVYALMREGFPSYFHLPALAEVLGEAWYEAQLNGIADDYDRKRATGTDRRGWALPPAKPVLSMTTEDIAIYKDRYLFPDRLRLCFDGLRRRLGPEAFLAFASDLFNLDHLDADTLRRVVLTHDPGFANLYVRWLETDDFTRDMRRDG